MKKKINILHYTFAIRDQELGWVWIGYFHISLLECVEKVWPNLCSCSVMISWSKTVAFSLRLGLQSGSVSRVWHVGQVQNSNPHRLPPLVRTVQEMLEKVSMAVRWCGMSGVYCRFSADCRFSSNDLSLQSSQSTETHVRKSFTLSFWDRTMPCRHIRVIYFILGTDCHQTVEFSLSTTC